MKNSAKIISLFLLLSNTIFAGGFQVNLQSARQAGMAHTGVGLLQDNSLIFFNPGGLCLLDSVMGINVGASFIFPQVNYTNPGGDYTANPIQHVGTPFHLYANFRFKKLKALHFGIGVNTPFGSRMQWSDDWKGKFLVQEINLKTIFIQPTISYKISDKLGLGVGLVIATGNFSLRKAIPLQNNVGDYGSASLNGDAKGTGFNAGLFYKVNSKFSVGLNYRSTVKAAIANGEASFTVPTSVATYFPNTTFTTKISLPSVTSLGIGYIINNKLTAALDINYNGWKSYDSLVINFAENTDKLADVHSPKMYINSFIVRAGTEYSISKALQIRAGIYYDFSPVRDGYLSPETPDSDKLGISAGTSLRVFNSFFIDLSLLYINGKSRTDTNIETQFEATYSTEAWIPSVALRLNL